MVFADYLEERIYKEIKELLGHCKRHYMKDPDGYADRHKVSAAVMISILKYTPIKIAGPKYYSKNTENWTFNEQLAITVGVSILSAFIKADLKKDIKHKVELSEEILEKFKNGIVFPIAKHGDYRSNWACELYYTRKDGNYNLLALAHELFFLEYTTANM